MSQHLRQPKRGLGGWAGDAGLGFRALPRPSDIGFRASGSRCMLNILHDPKSSSPLMFWQQEINVLHGFSSQQ